MKRRDALLLPLLLLPLAATTTGCVKQPSMDLEGARLSQFDGRGVAVELTMAVHNHNSFDVQLRNVRAKVIIADRYILPPVSMAPNKWLPAGATTHVRVPVQVPWEMVLPLVKTTVGSPQIHYRAIGNADVTATRTFAIDVDDYSVDQSGTLSRADLIAAAVRGGFDRRLLADAR